MQFPLILYSHTRVRPMPQSPTPLFQSTSFFEDLHNFFSPILLINYIISSLLICMVGLQIVAVSRKQWSFYLFIILLMLLLLLLLFH